MPTTQSRSLVAPASAGGQATFAQERSSEFGRRGTDHVRPSSRTAKSWRRYAARVCRREFPLNADLPAFDDEPSFAKCADGRGQQPVFDFEHPRCERGRIVTVAHVDTRLPDDRTVVGLRGDEMNRAAVDARAVVERTLVRIEPGAGGEQRRMDVEHPAFIAAP